MIFKATPSGAPGEPPRPGSEQGTRITGREQVGRAGGLPPGAGEGATRRWWAAARPVASSAAAHRRGPLLQRGQPDTCLLVLPPSRTLMAALARASRAVLPRRASCRRARITAKGAPTGAPPTAMAQAPPLTLIFHGKIRHLSGGRGEDRAWPPSLP